MCHTPVTLIKSTYLLYSVNLDLAQILHEADRRRLEARLWWSHSHSWEKAPFSETRLRIIFLALIWQDEIVIIIWPLSYFETRTRLHIVALMFRDEIETYENHFSWWSEKKWNWLSSRIPGIENSRWPLILYLLHILQLLHLLLVFILCILCIFCKLCTFCIFSLSCIFCIFSKCTDYDWTWAR